MAVYEAVCPKCDKLHVYRCRIDDRDKTPVCCGVPTKRKLSAPMGVVDTPASGRNTR